MNYVAFDLGASSGKVFLGSYTEGTLRFKEVYRFANSPIAMGKGLYWNFTGIYTNLLKGIRLARQYAEGPIWSIGIDSFSNDYGIVDQTGELMCPIRCYRDARTARCEEEIYKRFPPQKLYNRSGNQLALFGTFMQLASQSIEHKDWALKAGSKLLLIPDLLNYYLTGVIRSEYTISSVTQLYNYFDGGWDNMLITELGLRPSLFGEIVDPGTVLGPLHKALADELGVGGAQVTAVCSHDTASAFLAATGEEGTAIISSGTWSILGVEHEAPIISEQGFAWNIANEGGYREGHHRILANVMGSWLLQELMRDFAAHGEPAMLTDLLEQARYGEERYIDVDEPTFFMPGNMIEKVRVACLRSGQPAPQTPGEFTRCICISLAKKYCVRIEQIEKLTGKKIKYINIIGGGCQNDLLNQLTADISGKEVLAGPVEASALGNMIVQMIAAGEIAGIEEGRRLVQENFPYRRFYPNAGRAERPVQ